MLERTEIAALISRSGTAVAGRTLDLVRSQGVGLDRFVHRWVDRLLRRSSAGVAGRPVLLLPPQDAPA